MQHFEMHGWKVLYFVSNFKFINFVLGGVIDFEVSMGSGNGLLPSSWQAIAWTNANKVPWGHIVLLDQNVLM